MQSLMAIFEQAVSEIEAGRTEACQPEPASVHSLQETEALIPIKQSALAEIFKQVRNNQMAILSDGESGLYPYPRSLWISGRWSNITRCWFSCFREVFKAVEEGQLTPELSFHADQPEEEMKPVKVKTPLVTKGMLRAWKVARSWILSRLTELESYGWTRSKLFRAGQLKYPHGPWGIAFSKNWLRQNASFTVTPEGHIQCTWQETTGRTVTQTWRPFI